MPTLASDKTCTGCMACYDRCPKNAIDLSIGNDGHRYVKVNSQFCVECKLCETICPVVNGYSYGTNDLHSEYFAGWSSEDCLRKAGATSGIFGTIAQSFVRNGGWIAGAVMDGLDCIYLLSNSEKDIPLLQGSKYTSSNPLGIFSKVEDKLKSGCQVLFCGLPCHVAALLNFISPKLQFYLYTIDLICGGVSSPSLIRKYSDKYPNIKQILKFRDKVNGWKPDGFRYRLTYLSNDDKIVVNPEGQRNLITDGFACELTDRYSCYNCNFSYAHRKCDLTIGDFWRDELFRNQHFGGVSSLIVHSQKGKTLLSQSNVKLNDVPWENVLIPNSRIFFGKSLKRYFPERIFFGKLINLFSYDSLLKIYGSDLRTKNILWWPFALYRILSFRLGTIFIRINSKRILQKFHK